MISNLPVELLDKIISLVSDVKDLYNLCLASKALHVHSLPFLCTQRPTVVYANDEATYSNFETDIFDLEALTDLANEPDHPYRKSRCLQFKSNIWLEADERCFHLRQLSPELKEKLKLESISKNHVRDYWSRRTGMQIGPLLKKIFKSGQIEEFSWELGICPPKELLSSAGFLPRHQASSLSRLTLITGAACKYNLSYANPSSLALWPFRALKQLVWIGVVKRREISQLQHLLRQNASHLEHLQLDFVDPRAHFSDSIFPEPRFADILELTDHFPCLHTLSLAYADLYEYAPSHFQDRINWSNLTRLSLVGCLGSRDLMEQLSEHHAGSLKLKTFELVTDGVDASAFEATAIEDFLTSFEGLGNLYMHVEAILGDGTSIWEAVAKSHRKTLRRFAYEIVRWHDNVMFEWPEHHETLGLSDQDLEIVEKNNDFEALEHLACLGLAGQIYVLKAVLRPLVHLENLSVLHFRDPDNLRSIKTRMISLKQGGDEATADNDVSDKERLLNDWCVGYQELLDWIFGEDGISSVELVAYGNFSCRGRYLEDTFVVRRLDKGWVIHEEQGTEEGFAKAAKLLKTHAEFLESASTEPLLSLDSRIRS